MTPTIGAMLILLILLALMAFGAFGFVLLASTSRRQKKSEANAETILNTTFDGRPDVTVAVNMTTLKYDAFVLGGKQRGYKLVHQADNQYGPHTLIFEKA